MYTDKHGVQYSDDKKTLVKCPADIQGEFFVPDSVYCIGDYAFKNCYHLTGITIGKEVKIIGAHAFYNCWALAEVHLPDGLTHIGEYAFYDTPITSVDIPNTVTEIGDQAFVDCRYLTSIRIPDSVTRIGDMAFQICEALKSVHIGKGVQTIGVAAFGSFGGNTSVIETITVDPDNPYYDSRGNCNAIIETRTNTLVAGCNNTKIPDDIEHIAKQAFSGRKEIDHLELPKGLKTIGKSAFADCVGLKSVVIPDGVTSMGDEIFDHCRNLVSINIPNGVPSIGKEAFLCCNSLTTIALPESVQSIGEKAFCGCASLISVSLSEGITKIGLYAFQECEKLVSVIVPASVKEVGWYAFDECRTLSSVLFCGQIDKIGRTFVKCPCLAKIIVPKGTKEHYVKLFQEMEMASMSKKIREGEPSAVSAVTIQDEGDLIYEDDAKTILHACKPTATKVVIPETVKKIHPEAFAECKELTSVTIGLGTKSIKSISKKLFQNCGKLTHVVLGDSVTSIGVEAFAYDGSRYLGNPNLYSVTIPASVKKIGYHAFYFCDKLNEVHIADVAAWCNIEFGGDAANPICYDHACQKFAHHLYLGDEEIHDLVIPEGVTRIQEALFAGCADLTSVTIPNTVTEIGSKAFKDCTGLKTVVIPNSVTKIAPDAFDETVQLIK